MREKGRKKKGRTWAEAARTQLPINQGTSLTVLHGMGCLGERMPTTLGCFPVPEMSQGFNRIACQGSRKFPKSCQETLWTHQPPGVDCLHSS